MEASTRHLARETVLKALYASEIGESAPEEDLQELIDESELSEPHAEFARALLHATLEKAAEADAFISEASEHWRIERIATIDRLIMRQAIAELQVMPDVPMKVVLNEALELAKTFSTGGSSSFINGILDRYVRQLQDETGSG